MQQPARQYRYFEFVMVAFVVVLVCSNLIGPAKPLPDMSLPIIGTFAFGAGVLFFPLSYVFGDILTEVYGYSRARRVIWAGFAALMFAAVMAAVVVALPHNAGWENQRAYETAFGNTWRIALASMFAYFCGEFVNSFVLAKMKIWTSGRWLWMRTIGSTLAGEAIDSALFYPLAFYGSGLMSDDLVFKLMVGQFIAKVAVEIVFTPVTYAVVGFLKRAEKEDYYDRDTDFNPFKIEA
jgi:uncharacterized integral membrane protein (TIGR00697 family)